MDKQPVASPLRWDSTEVCSAPPPKGHSGAGLGCPHSEHLPPLPWPTPCQCLLGVTHLHLQLAPGSALGNSHLTGLLPSNRRSCWNSVEGEKANETSTQFCLDASSRTYTHTPAASQTASGQSFPAAQAASPVPGSGSGSECPGACKTPSVRSDVPPAPQDCSQQGEDSWRQGPGCGALLGGSRT